MTSNTSRRVMLMAKGATKAAGFKRLHSDREQGIGWEVWTLNDMPPTEWTTAHFELHAMTPTYREWISSRVDLAKYPFFCCDRKPQQCLHRPTRDSVSGQSCKAVGPNQNFPAP